MCRRTRSAIILSVWFLEREREKERPRSSARRNVVSFRSVFRSSIATNYNGCMITSPPVVSFVLVELPERVLAR